MSQALKIEFKDSDTLVYTNPSSTTAITADTVIVLGNRIGVAANAISYTSPYNTGSLIVKGVVRLAKDATLTISQGDELYWDVTNSCLTNSPVGPYAGLATLAYASTDAYAEVDLNAVVAGNNVPDLIVWEEDFIGLGGQYVTCSPATVTATAVNLAGFTTVDVGDATEAAVADEHGGAVALTIAATSEAEDAVIYHGDQLSFDIDKLQTMEFRAKVATPGTGVRVVMGMAGNHNLDKDTVAQNAWFSCDASLACKCETDDGTNDNDDKTAMTLTTNTYYWFKIDFSTVADVRFHIKTPGSTTYTRMASTTTFDMSNYTSGLQPYFSADKASGTGTATVTIDKIRIVSERD